MSRAREEVVELIPDRRLTYALLAGFPLRDYKAVVEIEPESEGGSRITWSAAFYSKYFGAGRFWSALLGRTLATMSKKLAAAAEARLGPRAAAPQA